MFFGLPIAEVVRRSVADPSPESYLVLTSSPLYLNVLLVTFRTALIVTVVCACLGYPYAYVMHAAGRRLAIVLTIAVLLPFWSSVLVRTYAWTVLLQNSGIVNNLLRELGWIDESLPLMRNTLGVIIGMTHVLLPFMVFPIYASMRRLDEELVPAAAGLGASPFTAFRRIFLPLTLPGLAAGCLLVFVLSLGFYITPALLGNPRDAMLSELIVNQVSQQLRFGVGSALGVVLLVVTLAFLALAARLIRVDRLLGQRWD